jgi:hypothetical protein
VKGRLDFNREGRAIVTERLRVVKAIIDIEKCIKSKIFAGEANKEG